MFPLLEVMGPAFAGLIDIWVLFPEILDHRRCENCLLFGVACRILK